MKLLYKGKQIWGAVTDAFKVRYKNSTVGDELDKLATTDKSSFSNISLAQDTALSMTYIDVPAGKGFIIANVMFSSANSGARVISISKVDNSVDWHIGSYVVVQSTNGYSTNFQLVLPYENETTTRYYFVAQHYATSRSLTVSGDISYLQLT